MTDPYQIVVKFGTLSPEKPPAFVQLIRFLCLFHACDYPQFLPVSYPKLYHDQWHRP